MHIQLNLEPFHQPAVTTDVYVVFSEASFTDKPDLNGPWGTVSNMTSMPIYELNIFIPSVGAGVEAVVAEMKHVCHFF